MAGLVALFEDTKYVRYEYSRANVVVVVVVVVLFFDECRECSCRSPPNKTKSG